ncbi:hypothetical protein SADUNF_Sadunf03G0001800 [Salix dunnii]|uniref:CCHC-type domain-containing protein n=1 Tax=Salix dunnii TaxID=1413687 RepID=A0A835K671_9ROSI|nr:hypothetical protein SADUNF_Sadunf03G0001800 [Salix dunnii]
MGDGHSLLSLVTSLPELEIEVKEEQEVHMVVVRALEDGIKARSVIIIMAPKRRVNLPNLREQPLNEVHERDEIARLQQQVETLTQQLAASMAQHHNPNPQDETGLKVDIPEFHGGLQADEYLDWINTVDEVLDFKQVPEDRRVALVATWLRGRAGAWWQQGNYSIDDYTMEFYQLVSRDAIAEDEESWVAWYIGGLRTQFQDVLNMFDVLSVSDAHQRTVAGTNTSNGSGRTGSISFGGVGTSGASSNSARTTIPPSTIIKPTVPTHTTPNTGFCCFNCGEPGHRFAEFKVVLLPKKAITGSMLTGERNNLLTMAKFEAEIRELGVVYVLIGKVKIENGTVPTNDVWDYFKKDYTRDERICGMQSLNLIREFELQRMKDFESIKKIVEKILVTVPEKYEASITTLKNTKDLCKITLAELLNALQAQEQRRLMRQDHIAEGALPTKHQNHYKDKRKFIKKFQASINEATSSTRNQGKGRNSNKGYPPCKHCGRTGHPTFKCWKRPDAIYNKCN